MPGYIFKRLLLIIPTLLGIMLINFVIMQAAPGGPIQHILATIKGEVSDLDQKFGGGGLESNLNSINPEHSYRGAQGIDPELIRDLEKQFGFDKPAYQRFLLMIGNYLRFDFGKSYFSDQSVMSLLLAKLPVSISLGIWTTLLVYFISIPLGIAKAVRDGTRFDIITSFIIIVAYAIPSFLFALLLIIIFAGGSFIGFFPLRGLVSEGWSQFSLFNKVVDYVWHMTLPTLSMVVAGFAKLTLLTKNSFLEEITKPYVTTARAKGLKPNRVLYSHVFRNAILVVVAGFPGAFVNLLFTSSLLIEVLFSLDGLGLLGFEAAMRRDYPLMFGTLYVFTLLGMVMHLIGDLLYRFVDPRIDLNAKRG